MPTEPTNSTAAEDWRAFVDGMTSFTRADAAAWAVGWPILLLTFLTLAMYVCPVSVARRQARSGTEYFLAAVGMTIWATFGWVVALSI